MLHAGSFGLTHLGTMHLIRETAPGQPYAHPVDRLERVERAAVQAFTAAELLEDARRDRRAALRLLQVLDEDLDGPADADQGHRLTRLVEDDGQVRVLAADLAQDLLGERGRLGHGEGGEPADLETGDVVPGRTGGDGR